MDDFIKIDDDFEPINPVVSNKPETIDLSNIIDDSMKENQTKENQTISLDRLFDEEEEVIDVYEENLAKEKRKQKRIGRIQIGLIVFLIVIASLVYFFGYDFFEPYIKID